MYSAARPPSSTAMRFSSSSLRHQEAIFGRPLDGVAERADPARDDRDLVHRVLSGQRHGHDRVAQFVIGDDAAFLRNEQPVLLLQAGNDPFDRCGEIRQMHAVGAAPRRQQRRLVDQIGEIGAGKARRQFGDLLGIDIGRQHRLFQMHLQDRDPILLVGAIDQNLAVEAAGAQQRGIEDLRPVGGGQQDDAGRGIETVELDQELVERLLLLVVAADTERRRGRRPARRARR